MSMYVVSWKIDMEAESPVEAAELAQTLLQGTPEDWVYEVTEWGKKETITVDLEKEHLEDNNE